MSRDPDYTHFHFFVLALMISLSRCDEYETRAQLHEAIEMQCFQQESEE